MRSIRLRVLLAGIIAMTAACSVAAAPSVSPAAAEPTVEPAPGASSTSPRPDTPKPTIGPGPSGLLAWPTEFDIELIAGTYGSSPPFEVPFTIDVAEPGWFSGHADPEFFDLLRFDGVKEHVWPSQMVAFGIVEHIRAAIGPVRVAGLKPEAALRLLADRTDLDTGQPAAQRLLGLDGARLDLHSDTNDNPILGRGAVELRQGPQLDMRLVLLERVDGMMMVGVLAPPGGLEAAWEHALPILATVRFGSAP